MKSFKTFLSLALSLSMILAMVPAAQAAEDSSVHVIKLSSAQNADGTYSHAATYDGTEVTEYDYTWHADPSTAHKDVKNAPAEYYTGTEPGDEAVYIAHDITYYPELDASGFQKVNYDGDEEWAYYYTAEGYEDYIFATLPVSGSSVPTSMMHAEAEAYDNAVLHITEAGTYRLEGQWHGQIWIDLGDTDDTFTDESAKVTIILNGVDVTCTVAPALVFYSVYECDNTWEDESSWSSTVDTSNAGANVIIADGTENNFTGTNVYRMLKTKYKDTQSGNGVKVQKKMRKLDGAFYSYVSMNIDGGTQGTGVLNINAGYEGLDSELHLTINGGNVNIFSQDDGINVNEDNVSVVTVNGGSLHILAGLGNEGDGVDSNGYLVINGGTVVSMANPNSDSGLDSDCGSYINGGTVVALGSTMDWAEADSTSTSTQATMNLQFSSSQSADEAIIVTDTDGKVVFAYDPDKDEVAGTNSRWYQGAVISCPALKVGGSYLVYVGGDVTGTETAGIYDASTVTGFTAEAKQQCYSTTGNLGGFGGGNMGGFDGGQPDGEVPELPDGETPQMPDGGFDGQQPDGTAPELPDGETPQMPDGDFSGQQPDGEAPQQPDGNFDGSGFDGEQPQMPGDQQQDNGEAITVFNLTSTVNGFSGVRDYTAPETPTVENPFVDIVEGSYYYDAVLWAVEDGVTTGTSDTTFTPNGTCTRAEAVTFLWRAAGSPEPKSTTTPFTDVDESEYYYKAVLWATEEGITLGTSDTTFSPSKTCSRAEIVTLLWRASGKPTPTGSATSFKDLVSGAYYETAVLWAAETGVTTGTSATTFSPAKTCSRGEIVTFLYRANDTLKK